MTRRIPRGMGAEIPMRKIERVSKKTKIRQKKCKREKVKEGKKRQDGSVLIGKFQTGTASRTKAKLKIQHGRVDSVRELQKKIQK